MSRSWLYNLQPIGIRTSSVESLTGYISRLALAHCVYVRDLLIHGLLPIFGRGYLIDGSDHNQSAFWKDTPALNSVNTSTRDWTQLLIDSTSQQQLRYLTLLPWSNVLSPRGLMRKTRAWCPFCYEEWRENGLEAYEPLLWSLEVVTVCGRHKHLLETHCPYCGRHSYMLAPRSQPGYCSQCNEWLGKGPNQGAGLFQTSDEDQWRYWVADVVGEMLEKTPGIASFLQKEKYVDFMEMCLHEANGNVSALSGKLGVSRRTVRDWCSGAQLPQLASMLRLCSILEISPCQIFSPDCRSIGTSKGNGLGVAAHLGEKAMKLYRVLDVEKIKGKLIAELQQEKGPPAPMSEVAKCLGYDQSFLYKRFPEICRAIPSIQKEETKREEAKDT